MASGTDFRLSHVFPADDNGDHNPLPKQQLIFDAIRSGDYTGGGIVYQGGKGSAKTISGGATVIWVHQIWPGTISLIGRESYPSLLTSTADEFMRMVAKLPDRLISSMVKPSKNSMGHVKWANGGETWLCSLSNSDVWESVNLGFAWVDEAHRQNPRICGDLETRLRQKEGPRVILYTTNPGGKGFLYHKANPKGNEEATRENLRASKTWTMPVPNWLWIEATTVENPYLPDDYHARLIGRYGYNTPAYKRWVLGKSTALEGSVFTEFDDNPDHCIHVVPHCDLPHDWIWGRGMDYGVANPTAVVWAAKDPEGNTWVDQCHYAPKTIDERGFWTVHRHAEAILDIDEMYEDLFHVPADPSMWAKLHTNQATGSRYSTAEEFLEEGVDITQAINNREAGLQCMTDLVAIDPRKIHPVTLKMGSPRLFILDRECNEPLIRELAGLLWAKPEGTTEVGRPDDCQKKDDHSYDALRYLEMEKPSALSSRKKERYAPDRQVVGTRGRERRY